MSNNPKPSPLKRQRAVSSKFPTEEYTRVVQDLDSILKNYVSKYYKNQIQNSNQQNLIHIRDVILGRVSNEMSKLPVDPRTGRIRYSKKSQELVQAKMGIIEIVERLLSGNPYLIQGIIIESFPYLNNIGGDEFKTVKNITKRVQESIQSNSSYYGGCGCGVDPF
jgi:hypothetical protein